MGFPPERTQTYGTVHFFTIDLLTLAILRDDNISNGRKTRDLAQHRHNVNPIKVSTICTIRNVCISSKDTLKLFTITPTKYKHIQAKHNTKLRYGLWGLKVRKILHHHTLPCYTIPWLTNI